jgi:hypothetical protein
MRSVSAAHWQHSWRASDAWQLERSAGVAGYRRRLTRRGAAQSRTRRRADACPLAVAGSPQRYTAMVCDIDTGRIDDRALSRTAPDSDRLRDMLAALWLVMDAGPFRGLGYRSAPAQARGHLAGANAILDVKMRTIPFAIDISMDFTLVGTAVHVEA